jgi:hypothetical protein
MLKTRLLGATIGLSLALSGGSSPLQAADCEGQGRTDP